MASKVYLARYSGKQGCAFTDKLDRLWEMAGFDEVAGEGQLVAIKTHFGEMGNSGFVRPENVQVVVERVKALGARPFLTDANTLYRGTRSDAVGHLITAARHGFVWGSIDAPVIIADGLRGTDHVRVPVNLEHFSECFVASAAYHADAFVVISHFKGHILAGFGAALKNVGMGLASRAGKQQQHSPVAPTIDPELCIMCGECVRWCPKQAISSLENGMRIDSERCIGCGECVAVCRSGAVKVQWKTDRESFQERMAEYAFAVLKGKRAAFFTFIERVTPDCDCHPWSGPYLIPPVGVLASWDPVALDQAALDLFNEVPWEHGSGYEGHDPRKKLEVVHGIDPTHLLEYAERIGIGRRVYDLEDIG